MQPVHIEDIRLASQRRWLDGSAFLEGDGRPRLWFHGTDTHEPFNVFTRWEEFSIGFHFGGAAVANSRIEDIGRMGRPEENDCIIVPVICRASNPLRLRDHYTWSSRNILSELEELGVITQEQAEFIYEYGDDAALFAAFELAGYDSVVYLNECEFKEQRTDSLIVWRAELLKSPYAASFDPEDPRLLPQIEADARDLASHRSLASQIESAKAELQAITRPVAAAK